MEVFFKKNEYVKFYEKYEKVFMILSGFSKSLKK